MLVNKVFPPVMVTTGPHSARRRVCLVPHLGPQLTLPLTNPVRWGRLLAVPADEIQRLSLCLRAMMFPSGEEFAQLSVALFVKVTFFAGI